MIFITLNILINSDSIEVKYKVNEKLVQVGNTTAVGKTNAVSGKVILKDDFTFEKGSVLKVDITTLKSDQERRDRYIKNNTLEASKYPYVEFYPERIEGLKSLENGNYNVKIHGKLKIRDIVKSIVWSGKIEIKNKKAYVSLKTEFPFDYFNLKKPKVPIVIEIDDPIILEVEGSFILS
ncbi:MAG: YceI family protein [candidate division WOR-3 bacterium]|nr:YceI family protein [candidate division WOR-3 bacterium]MCX7947145.1 YceI family protein [candidate division WOR-3 bacterium]MDW8150201.1 YceI family protein [candidate division WOR-3 bacterium]